MKHDVVNSLCAAIYWTLRLHPLPFNINCAEVQSAGHKVQGTDVSSPGLSIRPCLADFIAFHHPDCR